MVSTSVETRHLFYKIGSMMSQEDTHKYHQHVRVISWCNSALIHSAGMTIAVAPEMDLNHTEIDKVSH